MHRLTRALRSKRSKIVIFGWLIVIGPRSTAGWAARPACDPWPAKIVSVEGQVAVRAIENPVWRPAILNEPLCGGAMVRVAALSRAAIFLREQQTTLRLDQRTVMTIPYLKSEHPPWLEILSGFVNFISRTPMSLKVRTPFLNANIEGTEFAVRVKKDEAEIVVMEGLVRAENSRGSIRLRKNQKATAKINQAPASSLVLSPRDSVRWALYYPPLIDLQELDKFSGGQARHYKKAIEWYQLGKVAEAISALEKTPLPERKEAYFTLRAGLLLSVGRVNQANLAITDAIRVGSENATTLALKAIIALVNNRRRRSLRLAKQAVARDPASPVPRIALSYALQANFDLAQAMFHLNEAAKLAPDSSLLQSRIAELELALGRPEPALKAARRAVKLNPNLSYAETLLGFANLVQMAIPGASKSFQRAIALDSSAPLPRLGLGLAKIRNGELDAGTQEVEIAAALDPNNPLIRAYLGKSYYDQKRGKLAGKEFEIASELDPRDPTSRFYQAIQKQTENRPVEAVSALEEAIELNDNRLNVRSRQLVESDLAARNAALGRVFSNLGFRQRALVEGWNSLENDSLDYSGHRFLADAYAFLPRHEIVQASELLQSQILQPTNNSPVSPSNASALLSQSQSGFRADSENRSLLLIDTNGPANASLNEFRPLFNRDKVSLYASAVAGNQDLFADEAVISGINDNLSFSLGQSHFQTEGFRANNDAQSDAFDIYLQQSLSTDTRILAEYRYINADQGDLLRRFNGDIAGDLRNHLEAHVGRFGFHHQWTADHALSGSLFYTNSSSNLQRLFGGDPVARNTGQETYMAELQDSIRGDTYSLVGGLGYLRGNETTQLTGLFDGPINSRLEQDGVNGYLYSQIDVGRSINLTLGFSIDALNTDGGNGRERIHLNPKLGLIWNPGRNTTLRAVAFRTSKRQLPTNQTLEPTQIAGFGQFFNDIEDAVAWRYGIGIDQRFAGNLYAGAELAFRDLHNPVAANWQEALARTYVYWAPHPRWSFNTDYFFEQLNHPGSLAEAFNRATTHRLQWGATFAHPSGFIFRLNPSLVYQEGDFYDFSTRAEAREGEDFFAVVGVMAGYRLPKRYGFLSIRVENLFDSRFKFQETNLRQTLYENRRRIIGRLTINF